MNQNRRSLPAGRQGAKLGVDGQKTGMEFSILEDKNRGDSQSIY
jgi:hypothetical protein